MLRSENELQAHLQCHPVTARILWNRGLRDAEELTRFLRPELAHLPNPFTIIDMRKAVECALGAIQTKRKIAVYGDYDVDGTCGASLLVDFFKQLHIDVACYQPNRFTEGYGVHVAALERLIDEGAQCIITVDCGITAVAPARVAKERGVDLIIIDHHKLGAELPAATAVVNPQRPEDESGLKNLCGAGLAFFFANALRAALREHGHFNQELKEPNLLRLLDLVAVATIADMVDVRGVNRILVSYGLKVLATNPRVGLRALLEASKIEKPVAMHCGFVLGPRINAAGRLQSARAALDLLTSQDVDHARSLAQDLERINAERRKTQDQVHSQARAQALAQLADARWQKLAEELPAASFGPWPRALVLAPAEGETWHEGVVGIVASKIIEEFKRPAFVLAGTEHGLKGSVRSVPKIDILAAISAEHVAKNLTNFGGHAHAGGVSLKVESLQAFREAINMQLALTTEEEHYRREQRFDAEVDLREIDAKLVQELQSLEPFGNYFPEPILKISQAPIQDVRVMKEKHVKLKLERGLEAVWFNAINENRTLEQINALGALWVSPQFNEWQGVKRLQLRISHAE